MQHQILNIKIWHDGNSTDILIAELPANTIKCLEDTLNHFYPIYNWEKTNDPNLMTARVTKTSHHLTAKLDTAPL